jgi:hypothetical protein
MKAITDYWSKYYLTNEDRGFGPYIMCSLCANQGTIDTRSTAISPVGNYLGRINFCICPNGQALRKHNDRETNWKTTSSRVKAASRKGDRGFSVDEENLDTNNRGVGKSGNPLGS